MTDSPDCDSISEPAAFEQALGIALERIDNHNPDNREPVLSDGSYSCVREARSVTDDDGTASVRLAYLQGIGIGDRLLTYLRRRSVNEITAEQRQAIQKYYRFVNGPLWELYRTITTGERGKELAPDTHVRSVSRSLSDMVAEAFNSEQENSIERQSDGSSETSE